MEIATEEVDWRRTDKGEWSGGNFSPNGKLLTWNSNVDGNRDIVVYEIASRSSKILPIKKGTNTLGGAESAFTRDGSKLMFHHNGPDSPNDVWVFNFASGNFTSGNVASGDSASGAAVPKNPASADFAAGQ